MGIIDLIFPKSCLECGKEGSYMCLNCLSKVGVLNHLDTNTKIFSIFKYEGVIRKAITKIKYNFAYDISEELASACVSSMNLSIPKNSVILPIPLHNKRENWRGFNQSELIGKIIAKKLNLGFEKDILIRPIASIPQVGLKAVDRVRNISGKFAVNPSLKNKIDPKFTYIVFDDVATTGSTLLEAMKVLKKEGINKVFGLTIAK